MLAQPILVLGNDYTTRTYTAHSCELFAEDAYQAADTFRRGVVLGDILDLIENAPVAENIRDQIETQLDEKELKKARELAREYWTKYGQNFEL